MELKGINDQLEIKVRQDCTKLIQRCDMYMLYHPGAKLWIRDTDHMRRPIRLEAENVPPEDFKALISKCPKCGSNSLGRSVYYNVYYEDYDLEFIDV